MIVFIKGFIYGTALFYLCNLRIYMWQFWVMVLIFSIAINIPNEIKKGR